MPNLKPGVDADILMIALEELRLTASQSAEKWKRSSLDAKDMGMHKEAWIRKGRMEGYDMMHARIDKLIKDLTE